jgi:hypothetical protein
MSDRAHFFLFYFSLTCLLNVLIPLLLLGVLPSNAVFIGVTLLIAAAWGGLLTPYSLLLGILAKRQLDFVCTGANCLFAFFAGAATLLLIFVCDDGIQCMPELGVLWLILSGPFMLLTGGQIGRLISEIDGNGPLLLGCRKTSISAVNQPSA